MLRISQWEDNIRMQLTEVGWKMWTGSIWLRIGTSGTWPFWRQ